MGRWVRTSRSTSRSSQRRRTLPIGVDSTMCWGICEGPTRWVKLSVTPSQRTAPLPSVFSCSQLVFSRVFAICFSRSQNPEPQAVSRSFQLRRAAPRARARPDRRDARDANELDLTCLDSYLTQITLIYLGPELSLDQSPPDLVGLVPRHGMRGEQALTRRARKGS
jgi:hypothetical protein